jgi:hypothetical protein
MTSMLHPSCETRIDHQSLSQVGRSPVHALVDGQEKRLDQARVGPRCRRRARSVADSRGGGDDLPIFLKGLHQSGYHNGGNRQHAGPYIVWSVGAYSGHDRSNHGNSR